MLDYLNNESCDLYVGCHVRAKGGARLRGCGFTEFLSGERCIGFCLDKAQLSGRPMQIQDCPRLQEVLVGESRLLFFFPSILLTFLSFGDFSKCSLLLRVGFFLFCWWWWEFFSHDRVETAWCMCAVISVA